MFLQMNINLIEHFYIFDVKQLKAESGINNNVYYNNNTIELYNETFVHPNLAKLMELDGAKMR